MGEKMTLAGVAADLHRLGMHGYAQVIDAHLTQPAQAVDVLSAEDFAVLLRLRNALPDVGLNGWHRGVAVLNKLLTAALSGKQP